MMEFARIKINEKTGTKNSCIMLYFGFYREQAGDSSEFNKR